MITFSEKPPKHGNSSLFLTISYLTSIRHLLKYRSLNSDSSRSNRLVIKVSISPNGSVNLTMRTFTLSYIVVIWLPCGKASISVLNLVLLPCHKDRSFYTSAAIGEKYSFAETCHYPGQLFNCILSEDKPGGCHIIKVLHEYPSRYNIETICFLYYNILIWNLQERVCARFEIHGYGCGSYKMYEMFNRVIILFKNSGGKCICNNTRLIGSAKLIVYLYSSAL